MVLPFLISLLVTIIATPISLIFIKKWGLIDDPKTHKHPAKLHQNPVPRGGGIPLFIGIVIASLLFLPITKITIASFIAAAIALIIGTLDDKYDISPYIRFATNLLCALIIVGSGVGLPFITNPFGGIFQLDSMRLTFDLFGTHSVIVFSDILAVLWIVWVMNMLNWSKGVDGQMPGIVSISAIVIGLLSMRLASDNNTIIATNLAFIIAGACIGFLFFNFYPAKIFPGYGATAVYLLLATVSILSSAKLATAMLVMGVPMIDATFTIIRRIVTGHSPMWHDRKHLHHLLLNLGFGQRRIAVLYWLGSALLGTVALTLSSTEKLYAMIMIIVIFGGSIAVLQHIVKKREEENKE